MFLLICVVVFFQAEDGIRDLVRSRGLGDVYKRQEIDGETFSPFIIFFSQTTQRGEGRRGRRRPFTCDCLLYTSDAADDLLCVDLGGRRIIKKKTHTR